MAAPDFSRFLEQGLVPAPRVADALELDPSTVLLWIYGQKVTAEKAGKFWLINVDSLKGFLREHYGETVGSDMAARVSALIEELGG